MSLSDFSIGGYSFDDLGVIGARLDSALSAEGTLSLVLDRPMNAVRAFPAYTDVSLTEGGTLRWMGQLDIDATQVAGGAEQNQLVFKNVFQLLNKKDYVQSTWVKEINSFKDYTVAMLCLGYEVSDDGYTTKKISGRAQLQLIASQLQAAFGIVTTGLAGIPELRPPFFGKSNASLGQCLLAVLGWFPTFGVRSDLGQLVIVNTETSPLRTINLAALEAADQIMGGIAVYPRKDILKKKITIVYQTMRNGRIVAEQRDIATRANGSPYETMKTYPLEPGETPPDNGLAEQYIKWMGKLMLDMEFTIIGDLYWGYNVGDRAQASTPIPNWGADTTVIQTISRDLALNTVSFRCGARNHLGLDQLIELNKKQTNAPSDNGGSDKAEEGHIKVEINGVPGHESQAIWYVGSVGGSGDSVVDVAPGSYGVSFAPVFYDGRMFQAEAVTGLTVTKGQTELATAEYEEVFLGGKNFFQGVVSKDNPNVIIVTPSTIWGEVPSGMGPGLEYAISAGGTGYLYAVVNYNTSDGSKESVELVQSGGELESEGEGLLRALILMWSNDGEKAVPNNLRYGPVQVSDRCKDWDSNPPKYTRAIQ